MMKHYLSLLRVHQYVKNFFIFLPLFFGMELFDIHYLVKTGIAFALFSLTASGVYIFNDYCDREDDRRHPVKKDRPLASGAISSQTALIIMVVLVTAGLAGSFAIDWRAFIIVLVYIAVNAIYTLALKHLAIIDVMVIAVGFVLRLFVGSVVADVPLSMWIIIMTFLLALFLAFAKRRDDVILYLEKGEKMRKVIDGYNIEFLNVAMVIMAAVIIISYVMYTISPEILKRPHGRETYLTVIWVILGILRYIQLSFVYNETASPTKVLLTDRFLQGVIAAWLISFAVLIYL